MSRFISDQNKVVLFHESGTYGSSDGNALWPGEVTDNSLDDAEGYLEDFFLGDASRSVGRFERGPNNVTGTITYRPVDMMLIAHAIGSVTESSGTQFSHKATEIGTSVNQNPFTSGTGQDLNTPYSFTIEDSKQSPGTGKNFIRTVEGACIQSATINAAQGEKVSIDINYIGQNVAFTSGATTSVTVVDQKPYLWSDCSLTVAGSSISTAKNVSLEINQNTEGPHYLNGSRQIGQPFMGNREYTLSVTADMDSEQGNFLYRQYYKGGSTLIWVLDMNADIQATGSQHATFTCSGARITSMTIPSTAEGINEFTFEIGAGSLDLVDYTNPGQIGSYNPF